MRKRIFKGAKKGAFLILCIIALSSKGYPQTGERSALTIAIDQNYPPFSVVTFDGRPSGLLVAMWRLWSEATGIPVAFTASDWPGTLEALKKGKADIHSGLFRSEERRDIRVSWTQWSREVNNGKYAYWAVDAERGERYPAWLGYCKTSKENTSSNWDLF